MKQVSTGGTITQRLSYGMHRLRLALLGLRQGRAYREYLKAQFWRTFSRRHIPLCRHTRILVDHVVDLGKPPRSARILCVGCRNVNELDYWRGKGYEDVTGIDLYSEDPRIRVMDMHAMAFPASSFDVVYSSHSLEHSYDPGKVVAEIVRVARPGGLVAVEVPVRRGTDVTDRVDFGGAEGLHRAFGAAIDRVLWTEEEPGSHPDNEQRTDVARTVFTICKTAG